MYSRTYEYDDEDFDRFVLGDPGGMEPGAIIMLIILVVGGLIWWFK